MSEPNGPNVTKIEEAFLYVAPVHASVVRDARSAVQELVGEAERWHREALEWQQAKSEADTDADDARQEAHRLSETITDLERALEAADALADTYGRVWAKDAKFYAYQDARKSLRLSSERVRNEKLERGRGIDEANARQRGQRHNPRECWCGIDHDLERRITRGR